jgi:hypothetical protein
MGWGDGGWAWGYTGPGGLGGSEGDLISAMHWVAFGVGLEAVLYRWAYRERENRLGLYDLDM